MKKLVALAAALVALPLLGAETDKTIPMPKRDQSVKIGYSANGAKIESLRIQHYPDEEDVQKAKTKDLNDTHLTFWNFSVENRGPVNVKMKMVIEVIGKDGTTLGTFDKSDTVKAGKLDDNIRVWVKMKTLDIVTAKSAKLHLTIEPK